ncbi:ABC transporter substrate-binding protein [Moorena sp. SIO4G3]|uniref:ABC transporter substrate-binding protein n=1 Tax=Moorena sp. SIO4G3 TaxID=2607821 RepID=UPI00142A5542|nr:ABC transporter substrate-binding protein [Moorena sp. SIO4G3]NEO74929.1 ABC transporter substrate-binding protein [Moorena sp. SIO4G3]
MVNNCRNHPNPYIIGSLIDNPEKFFGRESLFRFIEDNLNNREKVILLHGQRRIGKSSILTQIPNKVANNQFFFVNFDLHSHINSPLSLILYDLAQEICDNLVDEFFLDIADITSPSEDNLANNPAIFSNHFLPKVYQVLKGKNLVLLLDEFDAIPDHNPPSAKQHFFPYLANLIKQHDELFTIAVVGRNLDDLPTLLKVFGRSPYQEIGFLDEVSAKRLIKRPAQDVLSYEAKAIKAIYHLSAGHPYFTQVLCSTLFSKAKENQNWRISTPDVEAIVNQAIERAQGGLAWLWDGLPIPEQVVFSAVAKAQEIAISNHEPVPEHPLSFLEGYGVETKCVDQAAKRLKEYGFVDDTERRVKVPLVRHWLLQYHPLRQEILALEKLNQDQTNPIYQEATKLNKQGKIDQALGLYEEVLKLNSNHFTALLALAQGYLQVNDYSKAVELYTRAYKVKPVPSQEGLLRSLLSYGDQLIEQKEFTTAQTCFKQMLDIDPEDQLAQQRLDQIEALSNPPITPIHSTPNPTRLGIGKLAAALAIITLVGVGFYKVLTPCPTGAQKVFGIRCIATPISRGEHSLFPRIDNKETIDLATAAFKNTNYSEAAKLFKEAWEATPNDPELLIYYNNARARQQGFEPFTIAVVVPIDQSEPTAKEILRGVAQAQHKFHNNSGGLNGRFLEIAIANDGNKEALAKKIAKALVNDNSILGVIGHNSSDASKAALPIYDKAGLAMISSTSSSNYLTSLDKKNNVFFRTVPSNLASARKLAQHLKTQLGLDKVVIFYDAKSIYSNDLKEKFETQFELEYLGGEVVRDIELNNPDLNITEEVNNSLSQDQVKAAMLFPRVESVNTAINIAKANPNLDQQRLRLFGAGTLYENKTLTQGKEAVEGLTIVVPWFREAPQAEKFSKEAYELWQGYVSWSTATSFDATQAFINALFQDADRKLVLDRLRNIHLFPIDTSGLPLQFTDQGEHEKSEPVLVEVVNGEFKLLSEQDQEGVEKSP